MPVLVEHLATYYRVKSAVAALQTRKIESWFYTGLGVLCFSLTFPMTRLALRSFDPLAIALIRGTGAGLLALPNVLLSRSARPGRYQLIRLSFAGIAMVVLFPVLISLALKFVPATHAAVVAAILPLATAFFGVVRGKENASPGFWIAAGLGTVVVLYFCIQRTGFRSLNSADGLLLLAYLACAYGYAEGGSLAKELGGWKVICWVLVIVLPIETVGLLVSSFRQGLWSPILNGSALVGLTYVTLISQYIGFFFYYRGLALGGVARMSQVQLLLPFLSIFASGFILGEAIEASILYSAIAVTLIVYFGKNALNGGTASQSIPGRSGAQP
ncbi:MAG: DMT family transporter [Verrucomicrobia bacterium]|nr:DMT family transporter [Verrucomicrobiota bacterium]